MQLQGSIIGLLYRGHELPKSAGGAVDALGKIAAAHGSQVPSLHFGAFLAGP
jgi:hypothetical protein